MTDQQTSRTNITEALDVAAQVAYEMSVFLHGAEMAPPVAPGWLAKIREWQARLAAEPRSDAVTAPDLDPLDDADLFLAGPEASPDEPSTEAGRLLVDVANDLRWSNGNPVTRDWLAAMVADIEARAASASVPPPLDVLRADVAAIMSGYPMQGGKPLGMGGRAFEQCREAVLHLIDRASPGLDVDRLAWAIETEDDRLPFLDPGIDSTATPRAIAERIAAAYAAETPEQGRGDEPR